MTHLFVAYGHQFTGSLLRLRSWRVCTVDDDLGSLVGDKLLHSVRFPRRQIDRARQVGELVANRDGVLQWETFDWRPLPSGGTALRAYNGQYVCAEGVGGRELVANRNEIGPWETFQRIDLSDGRVALRAANGQYVCAEGGGGRELVANRNQIGPWESFAWAQIW